MTTKSLTSYSTDGIIEQEVFWDTDLKKIQVIHYINLPLDKNAILSKMETASSKLDPVKFNSLIGISPTDYKLTQAETLISIFYYSYITGSFEKDHCEIFPLQREYYPLSNLPHIIVATIGGGGTASTVQGIAD